MGGLLTTASSLQCPHGGAVQVSSSNSKAKAGGDFLARSSDTFSISGCSFTLPGVGPHPCVSVKWVMAALHCKVLGEALLTTDSTGLCLAADNVPQGSVLIASTQSSATGT